MNTATIARFIAGAFAFYSVAAHAAPDMTCSADKEPGLSYRGDREKLPPLKQRKIIGTWLHTDNHLAVSLEQVNGAVYEVVRSRYCSSGTYGRRLSKVSGGGYELDRGEYYRIEPNGELGVYDSSGRFDVYSRRNKVFAD